MTVQAAVIVQVNAAFRLAEAETPVLADWNVAVARDPGAAKSLTDVGLVVSNPMNQFVGRVGVAPPRHQSNKAFCIYGSKGIAILFTQGRSFLLLD